MFMFTNNMELWQILHAEGWVFELFEFRDLLNQEGCISGRTLLQ